MHAYPGDRCLGTLQGSLTRPDFKREMQYLERSCYSRTRANIEHLSTSVACKRQALRLRCNIAVLRTPSMTP